MDAVCCNTNVRVMSVSKSVPHSPLTIHTSRTKVVARYTANGQFGPARGYPVGTRPPRHRQCGSWLDCSPSDRAHDVLHLPRRTSQLLAGMVNHRRLVLRSSRQWHPRRIRLPSVPASPSTPRLLTPTTRAKSRQTRTRRLPECPRQSTSWIPSYRLNINSLLFRTVHVTFSRTSLTSHRAGFWTS